MNLLESDLVKVSARVTFYISFTLVIVPKASDRDVVLFPIRYYCRYSIIFVIVPYGSFLKCWKEQSNALK